MRHVVQKKHSRERVIYNLDGSETRVERGAGWYNMAHDTVDMYFSMSKASLGVPFSV